ncbi:MAG: hypothetical protein KKC19_04105 [Nanoarchaeota archaeon]|nr:hypothetical protein [Nanoarchaeota archaeon]
MLGLFKSLRKERESSREASRPVFNIDIGVDGWQGPFDSLIMLRSTADKTEIAKKYFVGQFHVDNSGRLWRGHEKELHTFEGKVNLWEWHDNESPHVHYEGNFNDIFIRGGEVKFEHGTVIERPIYTLQGLYISLPNDKMNTRINTLEDELKYHAGFEYSGSIAKRKETRLRLLENKYRKMVSDQ